MSRDLLPPLFDILTGLGFMSILVVGLLARQGLNSLVGRLTGLAMLLGTLSFLLLGRATGSTSIGAGAELFAGAGAAIFLAIVLLAAALFVMARGAKKAEAK